MSVKDALQGGSKREALIALRDRIAEEIDGAPCCRCNQPRRSAGAETSALTLRLTQVIQMIESLPVEGSVTRLDEIRARRERKPTAKDSPRSPKSEQRRQGGRRPRRNGGSES